MAAGAGPRRRARAAGPDGVAQPRHARGRPGRGGARHPRARAAQGGARARGRAAAPGRDRRPEARARQYPSQLSGGMRQRVLIAIAVAARPRLVVADEPTSALDVTVQRRILDHLDGLVRDLGTAVLLITHDLGVAADRADRIVVLEQGSSSRRAPPSRCCTARATRTPSSSSRRRRASRARVSSRAAPRRRCRATASSRAPRRAAPRSRAAPSVRDRGARRRRPGHRERARPRGAGPAQGVHAAARVGAPDARRGGRREPRGRARRDVRARGESGSGKSTTARLALRLERPTAGTVEFAGEDITTARGERLRSLRRGFQVVYQSPYASLDPRFTVEQIVTEPLRAYRVGSPSERADRARALVEDVALPPDVLRRGPRELSGGQRQRVAIARALALNPALVVLDEPVSALDVSVQAQILELLVRLQAEHGLAYLFISHDLAVVRQVSDHVGVMHRGRVVEQGRPSRSCSTRRRSTRVSSSRPSPAAARSRTRPGRRPRQQGAHDDRRRTTRSARHPARDQSDARAARARGARPAPSRTELAGRTTELLQAMIRNACVNDGTVGSGHEARNARAVADVLDGLSLEVEWVEPQPGRTSLVARLRGTDPDAPSLALVGHTDVVPVEPEGGRATRSAASSSTAGSGAGARSTCSVSRPCSRSSRGRSRRAGGGCAATSCSPPSPTRSTAARGGRLDHAAPVRPRGRRRGPHGVGRGAARAPGSRTIAVGRRAARGAGCASSGGRGTGRGRTARSTRSCSRLRPCGGSPSTAARS